MINPLKSASTVLSLVLFAQLSLFAIESKADINDTGKSRVIELTVKNKKIYFKRPAGYCEFGLTQIEKLTTMHLENSSGNVFKVLYTGVDCDELKQFRSGKAGAIKTNFSVQTLTPDGEYFEFDGSRKSFIEAMYEGLPKGPKGEVANVLDDILSLSDYSTDSIDQVVIAKNDQAVYFQSKMVTSSPSGDKQFVSVLSGSSLANSIPLVVHFSKTSDKSGNPKAFGKPLDAMMKSIVELN